MRILAAMFFSLLASLALAGTTPDNIPGTTKIDAEKLIELVDSHAGLVLIDARTAADYKKGHIPGAINLTDTDTDSASLAAAVPDKTAPVVVYCNGVNCGRSVKSAEFARDQGYQSIFWFRGGWGEWTDKAYPVE